MIKSTDVSIHTCIYVNNTYTYSRRTYFEMFKASLSNQLQQWKSQQSGFGSTPRPHVQHRALNWKIKDQEPHKTEEQWTNTMATEEGGAITNNLNLRWISKDVRAITSWPSQHTPGHKHKTGHQSRISFMGLLVFCLVSFNCTTFAWFCLAWWWWDLTRGPCTNVKPGDWAPVNRNSLSG